MWLSNPTFSAQSFWETRAAAGGRYLPQNAQAANKEHPDCGWEFQLEKRGSVDCTQIPGHGVSGIRQNRHLVVWRVSRFAIKECQ
jgi:hypothetical protein